MTSRLPPRRRDTRSISDRVRQDRTNLRQLYTGLMDGHFPPLRPLGATDLLGDFEDDQAEGQYVWEFDDRLVVTSAGAQIFTLSHVPDEESLTVRWHPGGKAPITQTNEHWTLNGNVVTIPDPDGDIEPGDRFSAQYQYDPGTVTVESALTVVGSGSVIDEDPTISLPAGSVAGDLLVMTLQNGSTTDARLGDPIVEDDIVAGTHTVRLYVGRLSSLSDIATVADVDLVQATWAVFRAPAVTVVETAGGTSPSPQNIPSVAGRHAIFVGMSAQSVLAAAMNVPAGYIDVVLSTSVSSDSTYTHLRQRIAYWEDLDESASPVAAVTGAWDTYLFAVIGLSNLDIDSEDVG